MKKGSISREQFSYKDDPNLKFTPNNYLLVIKDEDFPDKNVIPILYYNNGRVFDIFEDEMDKIFAVRNSFVPEKNISNFKNLNQILKIDFGNIISNDKYYDNEHLPKCKIFANYINITDQNNIVEIFEGVIDESESRIKINEAILKSLIKDVYIEDSSPIFIESDNAIVGPFKVLSEDIEDGFLKVEKHHWKKFGSYRITDETFVEFSINGIDRKIHLPSVNNLALIENLEFKDDRELKNEFIEKLKNQPADFQPDEINRFLILLGKIEQNESIKNYLVHNLRIKKILQKTTEKLISDKELALFIPEVQNVQSKIEKLRDDEVKIELEISKKSERLEQIGFVIIQKQEEIEGLENKKNDLDKFLNDESQKAIDKLKYELQELETKKTNLTDEISKETTEKSKELNKLKEELENLKKAEEDLRYSVDKLKIENQETQRDSLKGLIDLFKNKKYFDFFSGRDLSEFDKKEDENYPEYKIENSFNDYLDFRSTLINILEKNGRKFETHFIDNLLISIHQNTLTIFAGLPGTGKTSLARLLTKILTPKERIAEVSVSRGWTSQKDLIGFQNPLTYKFHSAPTGVYELLCQLNSEVEKNIFKNSPLAYIILDEANLSPIEHYWSIFYNLTDTYVNDNHLLSITLGNNTQLRYANNLKFIATINYDQTTENLSPRIIDRANIVQIPELDINISSISSDVIEHLNVSYQNCIEFFKLNDFNIVSNDIDFKNEKLGEIFIKIKNKYKELRLPISPRVEIAIKKYCLVATEVMKKELSRPLDYCIAQRLLPMINFQGEVSKSKLEELLKIFEDNNLTISKTILDKIIKNGSEDNIFEGNYNYFLSLTYA